MATPVLSQTGFLKFFPVPDFLAMSAVGLDISDHAIRFVEVVRSGDCLKVGRCAEVKLPKGIVVEGSLADRPAFVSTLRTLAKAHKLHFVRVSLPEEKAFLYRTKMPRVPEENIRTAIEFTLEENVPFSASEVIFEYAIPNLYTTDAQLDVAVSVLPKVFVAEYADAISEAGLVPIDFELEANAIAKSVIPKTDPRTFLVVDFGRYKTVLSIVSLGVVQFTSTSSVGGALLTSVLQKYLKCSFDEAEKIKLSKDLADHRGDSELFEALLNALSVLKDEINRVVAYWVSHTNTAESGGAQVDAVLLSGKDALISGLDQYFSQSLKIPATVANVWVNVCSFEEYIPHIGYEESLSYAPAIGLALPEMHTHNF
ncbi:MAG: type 4 fimbrial biosis protein PilM, type pilus assembly protein PilM [Candidatus Parcubacteria bacterium]|jgi:type IV pilus assembly protein PilM